MSDKVLRPYQVDSIEKLRDGIRGRVQRQLLMAPTGSGKTLIAASMTRSAMNKGRRVMFLCDRIELLDQTSNRFDAEGIDHGCIQGAHWRWRPQHLVQIASIATIVNREFHMPDLVFVDECHAGGKRLNDFITSLPPRVYVVGLSATPFTRGLGKVWQRLVTVTTTSKLIEDGNLVRPIVYAPSEPDLTGIKVVAGEWEEGGLERAMSEPTIIGDIVQTWLTRANNRKTIGFAVNVAHSKHLVEQFTAAGVPCEHIDGYTNPRERAMMIERFKRGETRVIFNVGILDKGFDDPETSCCIYARPIRSSLSLYIQMGGRVLRAFPGKTDALILDHAGNTIRHGFLTDPLPEELDDGTVKKKAERKPKEYEPKKCPKCSYVKPRGVHTCPSCGFTTSIPNEVFAEAGELGLLVKTEDKRRVYAEVKWVQQKRGYSDGWLAHTYRKFTGVWPRGMDGINPLPPSEYTIRRIKHLQIAYAKAREKAAA